MQTETYLKAIAVGKNFIRDTEDMLLRLNILSNDNVLTIKTN